MSSRRKGKEVIRELSRPLNLAEFAQIAYSELRRLAACYFKNERAGHTLQPTALVHEAFLQLAAHGPEAYVNRAHFFFTAARAMRQILVEYGRAHNAGIRGGRVPHTTLDTLDVPAQDLPDYPAIDSALNRLAVDQPRCAQIAEMRIFAGLSVKETAEALDLAPSTVRAYWAAARAFLEKQLQNS